MAFVKRDGVVRGEKFEERWVGRRSWLVRRYFFPQLFFKLIRLHKEMEIFDGLQNGCADRDRWSIFVLGERQFDSTYVEYDRFGHCLRSDTLRSGAMSRIPSGRSRYEPFLSIAEVGALFSPHAIVFIGAEQGYGP